MAMCFYAYKITFAVDWLITCKDTWGKHICNLDGKLEAYN